MNNQKNIVIMRTDRIGEVLLSTVCIDAVKRAFPESKITFITSEYSRSLVEARDDIEEVWTVDTFSKKGAFIKALKLAHRLRSKKFDTVIILNPHIVLHLASFLAFIPNRIGYNRKGGFLLNKKIEDERDKGEKHEIEYTLDLLKLLGVKVEGLSPRIYLDNNVSIRVDRLLQEMRIDLSKPIVGVHPGSSNPAKIWPKENYSNLIKKVISETDATVIILGGKGEEVLAKDIIGSLKGNIFNLTGKLDLKELAALLAKTSLFIGNDTGPMHVAAALNVPVIAMFGRNIPGVGPKRWGPWGKNSIVFHKDPGCKPCYDTKCPYEFKCLKAITVEEVFSAAKNRIKN